MTLGWTEPASNGACPILGYSLYIDDGASGDPTTLLSGMNTDVPTLREAIATLDAADLGLTYSFKLSVTNRMGTISSPVVSYLFAVVPDTPSSAPTVLSTSSSAISV